LYRVQDALRPLQRDRVQKCGRVRVGSMVAVLRSKETGKAHFGGLSTCASVWACPVCSAIIRSRRAEEVRQAVEAHGPKRTLMLSLTVRHGLGHDLKTVRQGVAGAFRRLARGAPWKRFVRDYGLDGSIRGLDLTHGPVNGWHPHIHALLFFDAPLTELQLREARRWLAERWAACVVRELGEEHRPDLEHGTDLRPCRIAEYLTKLGLELTSPGRTKRGKGNQRTPMQIAYDFAERRDERDAELWRDYCDAMFGAKMLTWSRGLRKRLGLGEEATDEELVEEQEAAAEVVLLIEGREWDELRDVPGGRARVLEAAEREPAKGSSGAGPPSGEQVGRIAGFAGTKEPASSAFPASPRSIGRNGAVCGAVPSA